MNYILYLFVRSCLENKESVDKDTLVLLIVYVLCHPVNGIIVFPETCDP